MDRLDKISAAAIVIFLAWALVLVVQQVQEETGPSGLTRRQPAVRVIDPNLEKRIKLAKNLLANNSLAQAEQLIDQLVKDYPFEGMPFLLKGDVFLHRQEPIHAMLEYKKAVDLNPDFLDKNTELFQGKKIKKTVEEAFVAIEEGLAQDPGNQELKEHKKILYYMLRKIAGSCS